MQKIAAQLGIKAFEIQGRNAILASTGQILYRRALALVNEASELECTAHKLSAEILMATVLAKDQGMEFI